MWKSSTPRELTALKTAAAHICGIPQIHNLLNPQIHTFQNKGPPTVQVQCNVSSEEVKITNRQTYGSNGLLVVTFNKKEILSITYRQHIFDAKKLFGTYPKMLWREIGSIVLGCLSSFDLIHRCSQVTVSPFLLPNPDFESFARTLIIVVFLPNNNSDLESLLETAATD